MVGILVILAISWLLLHFLQNKNLSILGFLPVKTVLAHFSIGFILIILIRFIFLFIESELKSFEWTLNPDFKMEAVLASFWYHFKSALTEELVFRGAILYIMIERIGAKRATVISAIIFGIYHWFSFGMFGSGVVPMAYVFLITGFVGYVWAYTYEKTNSIMMPFGFHLAANFFLTFYLPNQPYGELLYTISGMAELGEWSQLFISLLVGLGPSILMLICVKFMLARKLI